MAAVMQVQPQFRAVWTCELSTDESHTTPETEHVNKTEVEDTLDDIAEEYSVYRDEDCPRCEKRGNISAVVLSRVEKVEDDTVVSTYSPQEMQEEYGMSLNSSDSSR